MATTVTVPGTSGSTISLSYDSKTNAALAQRIAAAIRNGVDNNTIVPATAVRFAELGLSKHRV